VIDFFNYYSHKGHVFGECISKANADLMYINIPKNASSWTKPNLLKDWAWEKYNYHTHNLYHKHAMIVLREPVERWISGIAEYMYLYHRTIDTVHLSKPFFDMVFDRIAFDDHTESQVLFLQGIDLTNCTFFNCDKSYKICFSDFLNKHGMTNSYYRYEDQHVTKNSAERMQFQEIFKRQIETNSKYKQQVEGYFEKDFKLINSIKFYDPR
jgi:hypothetical protein